MTIRFENFKCKSAISNSRLNTLEECTAKYAYTYLYKCPNISNQGAQRGSVVHDIFEILANKRHKKIVDLVLKQKTCKKHKALWELTQIYAKKYEVFDSENLELIDQFLITGLTNEFYGPKNTFKNEVEKKFDIEIEDKKKGIFYRITGFIDRINWIEDKENNCIYIDVIDYKSSKSKFEKKKIEISNQGIIYQIALKYLFPDIKLNSFRFLFLKFADDPYQEFKLLTDEQLFGYELFLTEVQKKIEKFSYNNIPDNYAAKIPFLKLTRCGKIGVKKDGTPNFICSAYKPFKYYLISDKTGKPLKSYFTDDIILEDGQFGQWKEYPGCSFYYDSLGNPK